MKKENNLSVLLKGILRENPVFVLVLGTCPTLATTTTVTGAIGMGLATLAVLVCSNIVISALRNFIPDTVRIPCYIVVIAGFVTVVQMLIQAFIPTLYEILGVYLALITVNCIILGRAEMFAGKNSVGKSALDGIGMGLGFTMGLTIIGAIREMLGAASIFGVSLGYTPIAVFKAAPGAFIVLGALVAVMNIIRKKMDEKGKPLAKPSGCLTGDCANCTSKCADEKK